MKMPKGKERIQVIVLAVIILSGVVFAGIRFVLKPLQKSRRDTAKKIAKINDEIKQINRSLKTLPVLQQKNRETRTELIRLRQAYIPIPIYGTYEIGIRERMRQYGKLAGLDLSQNSEGPRGTLPKGARKQSAITGAFRTYNLRLSLSCSLAEVLRLLRTMQQDNPYLSVSAISITARDDNREKHSVGLTIWWPIWANEKKAPGALEEGNEEGQTP